ncbi:hypothetical protein EMQ25_02710 [Arsenicitalea aurantiaca]|uniref:Uncharacterized protein n=1 Tax=Arsenicitalea aurantiaca TaxID=1783274 RepID=A0A433XLD0_9HYPH|nr:hypothetical protein [Arsenicitalea aurantiaca]RUT34885.1 hypothetical protein EMQ25_02710 [Arsenicitalea aurantiaca]
MSTSPVPAIRFWLLLLGFIAWSGAFVLLYGMLSVGCAAGWHLQMVGPMSLQRLMLVGLFILSLAGIGLLTFVQYRGWKARRRERPAPNDFLIAGGFFASLAALGATAFTFAPVVALSPCL